MKEMKNMADKDSYTSEDLDCLVECLTEAQKIMAKKELLTMVQNHAEKKTKQISALKDLRSTANEFFLDQSKDKREKESEEEDSDEEVDSVEKLREKAK